MDIDQLVRDARSTRRFDESERIGEKDLRRLVDLAHLSPCGGNQQQLRYRIVHRRAECEAIFPFIAWAGALKDWPGPAPGERPSGYILILSGNGQDMNVGIAAQTIQLAARAMGYGACMLGAIKRQDMAFVLGLPGESGVRLAVALGRPAETVVIESASPGESLAYYRSDDGVHHVPKLGLDDVLVG